MVWGEVCCGSASSAALTSVQSGFPAALEFRDDETIVGIDLVELPFRQSGGGGDVKHRLNRYQPGPFSGTDTNQNSD